MLKILQDKLQQYVNHELPDVQAGFRRVRGSRDQIANIRWSIENTKEFQKNMHFCSFDSAKAFDCMDHNKLWKILQEMGIPEHLNCLLINGYAVQGTLKSPLQHHHSKASFLWCSAFFIVELSHTYITTRKTIALTRRTFVGKVMSLFLNMLTRLLLFFQGTSIL